MQSGISASQELHDAFNALVSNPDQRALLASISTSSESLISTTTLPLTSPADFTADLPALQAQLTPTEAAYILLKIAPGDPDGYAAITYVPNAAPVRQKMLFASTRLTLVRELGIERFRRTVFVTEPEELSPEGWSRHEDSEALAAPLTEEEEGLQGVKDAEAKESQGTGGRRGHVSARIDVKVGEGVVEALKLLNEEGCKGTLVQLKFALPDETLQLESSTDNVEPEALSTTIEANEPRYSFYSVPTTSTSSGGDGEGEEATILFIYTCPSSSKIKERMVYSTGKSWTRVVAERDAGISVARSLEATEPSELAVEDVLGQQRSAEQGTPGESGRSTPSTGGGGAAGFARPKRPGRR